MCHKVNYLLLCAQQCVLLMQVDGNTTQLLFSDASIRLGDLLSFRVRATSIDGVDGQFVVTKSPLLMALLPDPPKLLQVVRTSPTSAQVEWVPSAKTQQVRVTGEE